MARLPEQITWPTPWVDANGEQCRCLRCRAAAALLTLLGYAEEPSPALPRPFVAVDPAGDTGDAVHGLVVLDDYRPDDRRPIRTVTADPAAFWYGAAVSAGIIWIWRWTRA
jgi:hypothetical protein